MLPLNATSRSQALSVRPRLIARNGDATLVQEFGDLDGVEGGAFAELVAADEEVEGEMGRIRLGGSVHREAGIWADAADEDIVFAAGLEGCGERVCCAVIDDREAGERGEGLSQLLRGGASFECDVDALGVCAADGDADAGCRDPDGVVVPDLVRLFDDLGLFDV